MLAILSVAVMLSSDSSEYNPELSYIAMDLSNAVYSESSVTASLTEHGFSTITGYNYNMDFHYKRPTFVIAEKSSDDGKIIAVIIRGTDTVSNWLTNISVGTRIVHEGFLDSRDYILSELLENYHVADATLFITGYSQGAAIANLLAAELTDKIGKERVFAYTFATPNVSRCIETDFSDYTNIFNICNTLDFVTAFPTHVTGNEWHKYGQTVYFRKEMYSSFFLTHHKNTYLLVLSELRELCEYGNLGDITDENTSHTVRKWDRRPRRQKWK